ncbi:heme-dependent oxidative N-demethylase subunit alpha family protein [Ramlibacter sp.]|uniref:heme-dependent oxidative N-demethylase subunit alpha family protein n=1 Tax=Ramlibacter sp. TaxID=1917967 RepID=UPI0035AF5D70
MALPPLLPAPDLDLEALPVPFRMQPGLRRLGPGERHLSPLAPGSALWTAKQAVVAAGVSRLAVPGFDAGPALAALRERAAREGLPVSEPLELAFEQDFAVLEAAGGTLPWLCVCVPSHWAPEDKLGQPLATVHAPVPDAAVLKSATEALTRLVTSGDEWERFVWTITPDAAHDQHPLRHQRVAWPDSRDPADFAAACWLRTERQTFLPVPGAPGQALFTIHVRLRPLAEAVHSAAAAARLAASLASMSNAVLAYKNLAPARAPLLAWLATWETAWN